jgi:hypothetical protein
VWYQPEGPEREARWCLRGLFHQQPV